MANYTATLSRFELVSEGPPWHARCPNKTRHKNGDRNPSLRLWITGDKLMCKCYAGCHWSEINAAAGLNASDWFPPKEEKHPMGRRTFIPQYDAIYDYTDEQGGLLFQVCRKNLLGGGKTFSQRRPIPGYPAEWGYSLAEGYYVGEHGGYWSYSTKPRQYAIPLPAVEIVPFHLHQLAQHPDWPVMVVEGEKDVLTLETVFSGQPICMTSSPMGAGKWRWAFGRYLKGRRVAVIPDNDEQGYPHAYLVASSAMGHEAESVRVVRWPDDMAIGADVSDWLMEFHAASTAAVKQEAVLGLIHTAKVWEIGK